MKEDWSLIPSLDGKYEDSTLGRIRHAKSKHIKAQIYDGHYFKFGYDYNVNHVRHRGWYRVHRAIAETFIPNPLNKQTVNHIDGNHANNTVENLEWATAKEQSVHAAEILHRHCGEENYNATLSNQDVRDMREMFEAGYYNVYELAEMYNKKPSQIRRIVNYKRWKHI